MRPDNGIFPESIIQKSIAGRYRPVRVADGPITARYGFIKNATWVNDHTEVCPFKCADGLNTVAAVSTVRPTVRSITKAPGMQAGCHVFDSCIGINYIPSVHPLK